MHHANSSPDRSNLSNVEDGNPRSIESDAPSVHEELNPPRDHDPSRMIHATTSDFFPPPSLQEDVHVATTGEDASSNRKFSGPRLIKLQRKDASIQQSDNVRGAASVDYRESLDGYKYRILKTPQLTNDLLSVQVPNDTDPTINQWKENEDYDYYFRQNNNRAPSSSGLNASLPNGMNDILSSHWWRTLYNNVIHQANSESLSASDAHPFQSASMRNRRASLLLEEIINNSTKKFHEEEEDKVTARIRVRSVQAASSIDVVAVLSKVFGGGVARASQYDVNDSKGGNLNNKLTTNKIDDPLSEFFASSPPIRHVFGRTNIIVQLSPPPSDCPSSLAPSVPRYVAIYRFGSVVFFNVTTKEASKLLEQIKSTLSTPSPWDSKGENSSKWVSNLTWRLPLGGSLRIHIEFKLDLIQQNAKFFLEVLHAQKSNTLEWVIIVLISFECVLMCLDMSGIGAKFFSDFAYFQ
ncbi:hypothetical protein HJC23_000719 [Cyclotella cryptica]|uniref:DUF155 domain-containing protein n=1 Tax=Cyclotella cryptica TaxID=29204 RepID=A0ABD3QB95_9STRA